MLAYIISIIAGLSPRVRGNPPHRPRGRAGLGSIPACAGEPLQCRAMGAGGGVYPRVCGGTRAGRIVAHPARGLSPRVRGNL